MVTDDDGKLAGFISQTNVVDVVWKELANLSISNEVIKDYKFGIREVRRILETDISYTGFERIVRQYVLAIISQFF